MTRTVSQHVVDRPLSLNLLCEVSVNVACVRIVKMVLCCPWHLVCVERLSGAADENEPMKCRKVGHVMCDLSRPNCHAWVDSSSLKRQGARTAPAIAEPWWELRVTPLQRRNRLGSREARLGNLPPAQMGPHAVSWASSAVTMHQRPSHVRELQQVCGVTVSLRLGPSGTYGHAFPSQNMRALDSRKRRPNSPPKRASTCSRSCTALHRGTKQATPEPSPGENAVVRQAQRSRADALCLIESVKVRVRPEAPRRQCSWRDTRSGTPQPVPSPLAIKSMSAATGI